jgi:gluconate 5-dehydrogenase
VRRLRGYTELDRIGRPIELCGELILLASDASSYVTGQDIHVEGG